MNKPLAIGIDASTQGVKAIALGEDGVAGLAQVSFAKDLPEFGAPSGYLPHPDPAIRRAPTAMWEAGIELSLERLGSQVDLGRVRAISGAAQQHGLVLAGQEGEALNPSAPIWMDHSTSKECEELRAKFGAETLRRTTGSDATERFTGPQIAKAAKENPEIWSRTAVAHCVASWLNSRLIGVNAPVDPGSASGQNLMRLDSLQWDREIAEATAQGLTAKLPKIVASNCESGQLCKRWAKHGLREGTPVVVWSGDNPDSLLGMGRAVPGGAVASLGTSDTFFASVESPESDPDGFGNLFCSSAGSYMALTCFTNGSLARDRMRQKLGMNWQAFDVDSLRDTCPGGGGNLLLPWFDPECTPRVGKPGLRYSFNPDSATPAQMVRALLESQALSMRLHSRWALPKPERIGVTGGASKSAGFLQILANVFQARIERLASTETVALGAAMRAWAFASGETLQSLSERLCKTEFAVDPDPTTAGIYEDALIRYEAFEKAELSAR